MRRVLNNILFGAVFLSFLSLNLAIAGEGKGLVVKGMKLICEGTSNSPSSAKDASLDDKGGSDVKDIASVLDSIPVSGWFVVDLEPPTYENEYPQNGSMISEAPSEITLNIWDDFAGLDVSSIVLTIDGTDIFTIDSSALSFSDIDSTLSFDPAGIYDWAQGDTAEICVFSADIVSVEFCGPNQGDFCWLFSVDFLRLWFPDMTLYPGDDVLFPLETQAPGRFGIQTYELWVEFNPVVASVNDVVAANSASDGFDIEWELDGSILHITATSSLPMSDRDTFLFVDFHIDDNAPGASYTPVILDDGILDDGRVGYQSEDGMIFVLWQQIPWMHNLTFYAYDGKGGYLDQEILTINCNYNATGLFDPTMDVRMLPPPPTRTEVYFPLNDPDYPEVPRLKRDCRNAYDLPVTWYVVTVNRAGSLYWNPRYWPDGVIMLNGFIDMERGSIYHYSANETLIITFSQPEPGHGEIEISCERWNLVSLPTAITVPGWLLFLEGLLYGPFEFNGRDRSYMMSDIPRQGFGFWVYSSSVSAHETGGIPLDSVTIPVYPGWNLVGSVQDSAWFTTDPPGIVMEASVFGWDCDAQTYILADTIVPGKGYWVLALEDGSMTIKP